MMANHHAAAVNYVLGRRRRPDALRARGMLADASIPQHRSAPFLGLMLAVLPALAVWAVIFGVLT